MCCCNDPVWELLQHIHDRDELQAAFDLIYLLTRHIYCFTTCTAMLSSSFCTGSVVGTAANSVQHCPHLRTCMHRHPHLWGYGYGQGERHSSCLCTLSSCLAWTLGI